MVRYRAITRLLMTLLSGLALAVAVACGGEAATPTSPPTATSPPPTATSSQSDGVATVTPVPDTMADMRTDYINYVTSHPGYKPEWGTPKYGGTLRLTGPSTPTSFIHSLGWGAFINGQMMQHNSLLKFDPWLEHDAGGVICDLCESYSVSADGLTYTFRLHEGVKFQSEGWGKDKGAPGFGEELTCEDVKASMDWFFAPGDGGDAGTRTYGPRYIPEYAGITCPDGAQGYAGVMTFNRFRNDTLGNLGIGIPIWNKEYRTWMDAEYNQVQETAKEEGYLINMGTGPFIAVSADVDTVLVTRKNPNYWVDGAPFVDGIEFYPIEDYNTKFASWVTGKVDHVGHGSSGLTKAQVKQVQDSYPDFTINIVNYNHISQLPMNPLRPPFDNWKVRQAVNLALDRGSWNSFNTVGDIKMSTPMYFMHPISPFGLPAEKIGDEPGYRSAMKDDDIAEANRLLDEVFGPGNRPGDTEITIWTLLSRREIGVWALDQFSEKLGWDLDAKFIERGAYSSNFSEQTYVLQPNAAPTHGMSVQSDPGALFWDIASGWGNKYYFFQGWKGEDEGKSLGAENDRVDALIEELNYTLDPDRRRELATYLERYYVEERTTVAFLGSMNVAWGTAPRMQGTNFPGIGTQGNWGLTTRWWLSE